LSILHQAGTGSPEDERALGFQEQITTNSRRQNNIPGAHKLTKGTDLTEYLQLILTSMMAKDIS
jgi:hypothetical protein